MAFKTASFRIVSKIGANLGYKKSLRNPWVSINFGRTQTVATPTEFETGVLSVMKKGIGNG
ncbi:hypothetical protein [Rhizobium sp. Rhizsp82]|uniref:hypothetical protein n=1 Tax=Rhizobium sp. Rhizsp82 TaxID=3243057 RepID=UPI0039B68106